MPLRRGWSSENRCHRPAFPWSTTIDKLELGSWLNLVLWYGISNDGGALTQLKSTNEMVYKCGWVDINRSRLWIRRNLWDLCFIS